jgi:hypothetical protein
MTAGFNKEPGFHMAIIWGGTNPKACHPDLSAVKPSGK